MGVIEDVQGLQSTIVSRTENMFNQLSEIASSASTKALSQNITASLSVPILPSVTAGNTDTDGEFTEDAYASSLYTTLLAVLVREIADGGYGIDDDDWARLTEAAREREADVVSDAEDEAIRLFSAGGFSYPTGAAAAAVYRAQKESRDKQSTINRDILSKAADQYLQAKGQVLTAGTQIEGQLKEAFSQKMERRLKKTIQDLIARVEVAVGGGNVTIARAKLEVDAAIARAQLLLEAAKANAMTFTQLATASLSGLHVNTSLGADANASESWSGGNTESTSYNHNYQEK